MSEFSALIGENISKFVTSDVWKIIKYRLLVEYIYALQKEVNSQLRDKDFETACRTLGKMEGVAQCVEITERLVFEIKKGRLDVDAALDVIENNQRSKTR